MGKSEDQKKRRAAVEKLIASGVTFADHDPMRPKPHGKTGRRGGTGGTDTPGGTGSTGGTVSIGTPGSAGDTGGTGEAGYMAGERHGNTWIKPDGTAFKGKKVWFDPALLSRAQRAAGRRRVSFHTLIGAALVEYLARDPEP